MRYLTMYFSSRVIEGVTTYIYTTKKALKATLKVNGTEQTFSLSYWDGKPKKTLLLTTMALTLFGSMILTRMEREFQSFVKKLCYTERFMAMSVCLKQTLMAMGNLSLWKSSIAFQKNHRIQLQQHNYTYSITSLSQNAVDRAFVGLHLQGYFVHSLQPCLLPVHINTELYK